MTHSCLIFKIICEVLPTVLTKQFDSPMRCVTRIIVLIICIAIIRFSLLLLRDREPRFIRVEGVFSCQTLFSYYMIEKLMKLSIPLEIESTNKV